MRVHGRVIGADGSPVRDAPVRAFGKRRNIERPLGDAALTGADGRYHIDYTMPKSGVGRLVVRAYKPEAPTEVLSQAEKATPPRDLKLDLQVAGGSIVMPLTAGKVGSGVMISAEEPAARFQHAFAFAASGGTGSADLPDVVWIDGDSELLVRPSRLRVLFESGFALVGISVYTEQTGDVEVVVAFALGQPDQPLGLVAATEPIPRGPARVVDVWGDPLVAAAWEALLRVAADAAAATGVDDEHERLLPGALTADKRGLTVVPQARHAFDRRRR